MLLDQMNWMQTEEYLEKEDRLVLVLGSTEEHGYYSLGTDTQCPFEIARVACEEEGVALAPALPFGPSDGLMAYPGTVSLDNATYLDLVDQILRSFISHGFRRILILNGHGGNKIAERILSVYREENPDVMVKFRSWYLLPGVLKFMEKLGGSEAHHGTWIEGFPWINQFTEVPDKEKPDVNWNDFHSLTADEVRERLGDGTGGGVYKRDEKTLREYFRVAVDDVLDILRGEWTA